jgi:pSer/pThr/pTyr-binding forkhead associated (FHA) protein
MAEEDAPAKRAMMWRLETNSSSPDSTTFRLPAGSVKTIGRSPGAEFILDAPLVSRLHCQLAASEHVLEVKDLDSTNGTFVNDQRIRTARLKPGDRLTIGRVELTVSREQ